MLHKTSAATPGHKPVCPGDFAAAGMRRMDLEMMRGSLRRSRPQWHTENKKLMSFIFRVKVCTAYQKQPQQQPYYWKQLPLIILIVSLLMFACVRATLPPSPPFEKYETQSS